LQPIRTAAEITAQIKINPVRRVYMYQKCSQKAKELRLLGMSYQQIAKSLNVSRKTVINAYKQKKI
jgi:DNA-binding XRE family transcriptional regulator